MSTRRYQTWLALIVAGVGLLIAAILGLWAYASTTATPLHPNPQDVPSVTHSAPSPKWADAVERGRQIVRAGLIEQNLPGLSVAVGVDGDIVWAEGFGWADLEQRERVAPETRFRIGTASTALTSAAAGLLLEKGRLKLDDEIQTYVPAFPKKQWPVTLRHLMGHLAGVRTDGGDEGPLLSTHCERTGDGLQAFAESSLRFEPGPGTVFGLRLDPGKRGCRSRRGRAILEVHAGADLRAAWHGRHEGRLRHAADPESGDLLLPEVRGGSTLWPAPDARDRLFLLRGILRIPVHPVRSSALRHGDRQPPPPRLPLRQHAQAPRALLQPATVQLLQTSQRLPSGEETGYGLGWDLETVALAGEQTGLVGHDGESLGGMVASFMTFPKHGIAVSVTSNISYADTYSVAVSTAQAFAEQGNRPARK